MKNAKFSIDINFDESNNFTKNGLDKVEFLISTNIGEDSKPLAKIASGGEMSRIMLSIKNVLSEVDEIPIMIFDEIDTGISGIAANKTGEKIKKIALNHQVICVTHLASIAAKGDHNYYIYKDVENNKTRTNIKELNEQEVLEELARITSGNITDISLKHAKELRKSKLKIA
jgi:DNA repair protein RecN (Recombination protein N)